MTAATSPDDFGPYFGLWFNDVVISPSPWNAASRLPSPVPSNIPFLQAPANVFPVHPNPESVSEQQMRSLMEALVDMNAALAVEKLHGENLHRDNIRLTA